MEAIYHHDGPSFGKDNPLIESLPTLPDGGVLYSRLSRKPAGNFNYKEGTSSIQAFSEISTLLDFHHPRLESRLVLAKLASMLHNSYRRRPPQNASTQRWLNSISSESFLDETLPPADIITVIGGSGMGKSTMIKSLLQLFPKVISHSAYQGRPFHQKQIVWISVDAPAMASPKGLFQSIAQQLDRALDIPDTASYASSLSGSIENQKVHLTRALASHYVGLIHIDDLQRLGESSSQAEKYATATLISMANVIGASLILSGTPAARSILENSFEAGRRATRRGVIQIVAPASSSDPYFSSLVHALFRFQLQRPITTVTEKLISTLLNMTAGVTGVLVSLYVATQEIALLTEQAMDSNLFEGTMAEQFDTLIPAIRKLNTIRTSGKQVWDPIADFAIAEKLQAYARKHS